jgi:hypothetical protein
VREEEVSKLAGMEQAANIRHNASTEVVLQELYARQKRVSESGSDVERVMLMPLTYRCDHDIIRAVSEFQFDMVRVVGRGRSVRRRRRRGRRRRRRPGTSRAARSARSWWRTCTRGRRWGLLPLMLLLLPAKGGGAVDSMADL